MTTEIMQPVPVPDRPTVMRFFEELLGRDVLVKDAPGPLDATAALIGEYVDDEDTVLALFVAEPVFAAASGASLMMLPAGGVEDVRKGGPLSETMLDCFREVVNVYSRLLNSPESPHLKLRELYLSPADVSDAVRAVLTVPCRRADFTASVNGYGDGRFAMLFAD